MRKGRCNAPHGNRTAAPFGAVRSPIWWAALVVLVLNDHWLKGAGILPATVTGKLSDFAWLLVVPPVLACLLRVRRERTMLLCTALVGAVFSLLKTWPAATEAVVAASAWLGVRCRIWCDPSDLVALPMLLVGHSLALAPPAARAPGRPGALEYAGVLAGAVACLATSFPAPQWPSPNAQQGTPGTIFVNPDRGEAVYAIDSETGQIVGRVDIGRERPGSWVSSGDVVYFADEDGVRAVDARADRTVFQRFIGCRDCKAQLLLGGSRLFAVITYGGDVSHGPAVWVFAIDAATGNVAWYRKAAVGPSGLPDEARQSRYAGGRLVIPGADGLAQLRADTGEALPTRRASAPAFLKLSGRAAYFITGRTRLVGVDLDSGAEVLNLSVSQDLYWPVRDPFRVAGGRLFCRQTGDVVTVDLATGTVAWKRPAEGLSAASASVVLVPVGYSEQVALDAKTGRELWRTLVGAEVDIAGGIVLQNGAQSLDAYDALSGRKLWSTLQEPERP